MAALPTSQTHKRRAPPFGSQSPTIRRPVAVQLGRGGPFLTRVPVCALIHGPTWASSPFIQTPVEGQHHCSRERKTSTYRVWAASRMLPNQHLKIPHHRFHPYPLFRHHLTPSRTRIRRERALPLSGVPPKTVA